MEDITKQLKTILENGLREEPTILVIDDEPIDREIIGRELQKGDFKYILCEDGEDMVRVITSKVVSLVITDLNMPKLDGLEIAQLLQNHDIPCIIVSDHNKGHPKVLKAKELKIPFINKSKLKNQLLRKVKRLLKDER